MDYPEQILVHIIDRNLDYFCNILAHFAIDKRPAVIQFARFLPVNYAVSFSIQLVASQ